ncbi:hypothetical protein EXE10_09110 [Acinetobacter sp. WCHAc060033]|uniref:hypothetical protein n=1 Tax=Acinetobacter sp. WCHAc060033 TaxID=2518624 RepID=UPI001023CA4B|nr:hypothetical protein [Acinetobacter sp. WCHAc060033]RZG85684.1 hypothetical protein EXE10_09110 [Acinetobacter sp. WCHAc060033]
MTYNQKINIYSLKFEDFCLLSNPRYLGCKQTEKAFYDVQMLLKSRNWSDLVGSRFSWYFINGLIDLKLKKEFIAEVINEVEHLENPNLYRSITEAQTLFKYDPLKGLWHKHYHLGNLKNIRFTFLDKLIKNKKWEQIKQEVRAVEKKRKKGDSNLSLVLRVLKKHTIDVYQSGFDNGTLTGEWIIYHEVKGKKYYLGLWKHEDGDVEIAKQINQIFQREFPEFENQLPIFTEKKPA